MRSLWFPVCVILLAGGSALWQHHRHPERDLPGDSLYYALTAESLVRDGDFDLTNQLLEDRPLESHRDELKAHEGFFAVSPTARVVPKHSTLLPIVSLPFIALFGADGFLIANVALAIGLVLGVAKLGGDTPAASIVSLVLFATSSWLGYCQNFSPDLFVAALVAWSFAMVRSRRWLLAGLLAGFAVWAKVYAVVVLLPLALVLVPAGWRATFRFTVAAVLALAPMLVQNHVLYGGPFVTGYDRDARVDGDGFRLTEHYSRFHQPWLTGMENVLFDGDAGMIRTAPLWFLTPFALVVCRRDRFAWCLALGAIANVSFFAFYDEWNASTGGNRFLFPAVALGGGLLGLAASTYRRPA